MELVRQFIDVFLHVDVHLAHLATDYGTWIYLILFVVIFCETGLVVTPFLPGDSLLFAAGALCAASSADGMNIAVLIPLLALAAFSGDQVNYRVGRVVGPALLRSRLATGRIRLIKTEHVERTQAFYAKHGAKTVILARFVPIVRTFCPPVAGAAGMPYSRYVAYDIFGGILWVGSMIMGGYLLGRSIPDVGKKIHYVIAVVVVLSVLPAVISIVRERRAAKSRFAAKPSVTEKA